MPVKTQTRIPEILKNEEQELLADWMQAQMAASTLRSDLLPESALRSQSTQFLRLLREAMQRGDLADLRGPEWRPVYDMLDEISRTRALQGFSPSETATFVLSLKQPVF